MRSLFGKFLLFLGCLLPLTALTGAAEQQVVATQPNLSQLVQKISPSVVNVTVARLKPGQDQSSTVVGSGFVIDAVGLVVTNNHVVENAREIYVTFADGTRRLARLEGSDAASDIALLRIPADRKLLPVVLGNSDEAKPGDWVLAIGNPFGFGGSVSAGIISARNRQLETDTYDDFIQTDAAINRGSSGGPLFDLRGRVVGVNSALISPNGGSAGVSFAIPANTVKFVVAQLREAGHVRRGWIGMHLLDLTPDLAEAFSLVTTQGALVRDVTPAGPSAVAGLIPGDIITQLDGNAVSDSRSVQKAVAEAAVGRLISLTVFRKGQKQDIKVRTSGRVERSGGANTSTDAPIALSRTQTFGLDARPLTPQMRVQLGIGPSSPGLFVMSVAPGSPGAEADVRAEDLIVEVGQKSVTSTNALRSAVSKAREQKKRVLLVTLMRGGEMVFKALRLGEQKVDASIVSPGKVAVR